MILSYENIEEIAMATVLDFRNKTGIYTESIDVDKFANDYLSLDVSYAKLSNDGVLCGVTAYADTEFYFNIDGSIKKIPIKQNEIILDSSFLEIKKLANKRRFTLAHECSHQLLYALESDERKLNCRKMYNDNQSYSIKELKCKEDWNEWQANSLAAAILMPPNEVEEFMMDYTKNKKIVIENDKFGFDNNIILTLFCGIFSVSKRTASIRLKKLGFLKQITIAT